MIPQLQHNKAPSYQFNWHLATLWMCAFSLPRVQAQSGNILTLGIVDAQHYWRRIAQRHRLTQKEVQTLTDVMDTATSMMVSVNRGAQWLNDRTQALTWAG